MEDKKHELLDVLVTARSRLMRAVHILPAELEDTVFLGTWTVKEVVAHLAGWDITNLQALQEISSGQYPSFLRLYDRDWQSYNHQLVNQYRRGTIRELIVQAESSHSTLLAYLRQMDASLIVHGTARSAKGRTITIRNLIRSEANDEQVHAAQVEDFYHRQRDLTLQK